MIVGYNELADNSVLKLTSTAENQLGLGIFRDAVPKWNISDFPSHNFENELLQYEVKGPGNQVKRRVGIVQPCGSRLTPCPCPIILSVSRGLDPQEDDAKFFGFSKSSEDDSHRAGMCNRCPMCTVFSATLSLE